MTHDRSNTKLWRIFTRKERWGLSRKGWLVLAAMVCLFAVAVLFFVHPFLAMTDRVEAKVLVVEGWVHEFTIRAAVEEFRAGSYERVFTTGGPVEGSGGYINDFNTTASVAEELLKKNGLPDEFLQMVPSRVADRDRTYHSIIALRNWLQEHQVNVRSINVVTEDAHSRRTRLLFQKVFGPDIKIGVVSVPNPDYDAKRWWRYSEGVREVLGEAIGYLHARLSFHRVERENPSVFLKQNQ